MPASKNKILIVSSMNNCGGSVNHGTSGHDSKEDSRSFAPAEYCDHCDKEQGRNDEDGGIHFAPPSNESKASAINSAAHAPGSMFSSLSQVSWVCPFASK
jgi:hypothetical protein